ncbi:peptidyl-prolyl isomerase E (cyclophilin E) [Diplonema papillatum]|nr:peptidyl-prolyl isomerase E (cyclophilin E) [Diplonema papillatum]
MSSDEDDSPPEVISQPTKLGSLFAMDKQHAKEGNSTFQWRPPKKEKKQQQDSASDAAPLQPTLSSNSAAAANAHAALESAQVKLFRNQEPFGLSLMALRAKAQGAGALPEVTLVFVDKAKKPLLAPIPIDPDTYWVQTPYDGQQQFASFQDTQQNLWMAQFRTPAEATAFTFSLYCVQHSLSLLAGQSEPRTVFDLLSASEEANLTRGDLAGVRYKYYRLDPHPHFPSLLKLTAPPYDETAPGETKKVRIGDGKVMTGVEEQLVSMGKGQQRFVVVCPDKTRTAAGRRDDNLSEGDTVAAFLELQKVKKPAASSASAVVVVSPTNEAPPTPAKAEEPAAASPKPQEPAAQPVQPQPAQPVQPAAPAALDPNALLTTLLMNQLQPQKQSGSGSSSMESSMSDVSRGMDRLMVQMGQLYQKMDHIDVSRKLEENNAKIESMFRRAIGKAPSAGYDPLAQGIDREADTGTLLAEVEKRDKRIAELTDSYHNALSSISASKEESSALKSDLQIERDTAIERLKEAQERHRLAFVELGIKRDEEKDRAVHKARQEGKDDGFRQGKVEGEREAMLKYSGGDPDEVFRQLQQAREENNQLQSELISIQGKLQNERRQHDEQMQLMNSLVAKYEEREHKDKIAAELATAAGKPSIGLGRDEVGLMLTKSLKKIMNGVYFRIEEDLNAEPQAASDSLPAATVLTIVTKAIKSSTKQAIAAMKEELDELSHEDPEAAALHAAMKAQQTVSGIDEAAARETPLPYLPAYDSPPAGLALPMVQPAAADADAPPPPPPPPTAS